MEKIFSFHNRKIVYTALIVIVMVSQFLFMNDYLKYVIFARTYLSIFATVLLLLIPLILFVAILAKRRKYARNIQKN